ncbi:GTP pyrophosphokinase [Paraburkholderia sediminicola]|uniref:GTP pyrophosphokinase n=1 Tax=Paraburkholderia sediminicola TaxID=458836 RepID=UPI0038BC1BC5
MDLTELKARYEELAPLHTRVAANIKDVLQNFLLESSVPYVSVSSRVKDFDSFCDKVDSKGYKNPFDENTDFVGVRAILYFPSDIDKISDVIKKEFAVVESEDKSDKVEWNEFGYRSHHFIVKVPGSWSAAPNYRNLTDIKIEIQIRTVLMHAWAEIEHKLQYKNRSKVPGELRRKLARLSAKLEEADENFQDLKESIEAYKTEVAEVIGRAEVPEQLEVNIFFLQELLQTFYGRHKQEQGTADNVLEEIVEKQVTAKQIISAIHAFAPLEPWLEERFGGVMTAGNMLSFALETIHPGFWSPDRCNDARNNRIRQLRRRAEELGIISA